jgi:DNA primase
MAGAKVVALMGSFMSAAQEELIRKHTNGDSQIILMLDEDEAGQTGARRNRLAALPDSASSEFTSSANRTCNPKTCPLTN